jgi:hypothetical protein
MVGVDDDIDLFIRQITSCHLFGNDRVLLAKRGPSHRVLVGPLGHLHKSERSDKTPAEISTPT